MKILIITVTLIALAAVVGSIIVGEKVFDGLVVEKPYDKGLQWDKTRKEKAELGWNAVIKKRTFHTGNNDVVFNVLDKDGSPLAGALVTIIISRPSSSAYDKYYETATRGDGIYKASINFPLNGYWDVKINVTQKKRNVVFEEKVYVEK
jgi:nitrogen fixation protein FixH